MQQLPLAILRPKTVPPREKYLLFPQAKELPQEVVENFLQAKEMTAVDVETNGVQIFNQNVIVVGIGFANSLGSCYVDVKDSREVYKKILISLYESQTPLMAHNMFFDQSIITRDLNLFLNNGNYPNWFNDWKWLNFRFCTLAGYKHLANEGWTGQVHDLKSAMKDLLGWEDTNEHERDRWLVEHGYTKRNVKKELMDKLTGGTTWQE